ncbi:MAG: hypothetical protein NWE95_08235 [Candidatus Bathyarchaeota archaeon]|nr:hypothetical protein [Candidatus Bathyarchaeota archaeon]
MTCYFRHLTDVFEKAGIKVTRDNRKELGRIMHDLAGEADCPAVWKQIKKRLAEDQEGFIAQLKTAWDDR